MNHASRLDAIVRHARSLRPAARVAYLACACEGDAALLHEVSELLAADGESAGGDRLVSRLSIRALLDGPEEDWTARARSADVNSW